MSTGLAKLTALACAAVMSGAAILGTAEAHPAHHAAAHAAKRHHHHHHHHHKRRHRSHGIPQHNGGDHDGDNNGGPTDGDGNV
jgi:hypothetical protein